MTDTIPVELANLTYMVRHNPNCPKPFEVRLSGRPVDTDDIGYGMTLEEAARAALAMRQDRLDAPNRRRAAILFREVWSGL